MDIKINTSEFPTWNLFEQYGIQQAYPTFTLTIEFFKDDFIRLFFKGKYYCCGSADYDEEERGIDDLYDVDTIILNIESIKESIKSLYCKDKYIVRIKSVLHILDNIKEYYHDNDSE